MKSTHVLSVTCRPDSRVHLLSTMIVAVCAVLVVCPALAQDAATAGGDVAPAGGPGDGPAIKGPAGGAEAPAVTNHGINPVTPQRGIVGLQRRANLKALIPSAPHQAAGLPLANVRVAPLLVGPGIAGAVPRNPIGAAIPGTRSPDHDAAHITIQAGTRLTGLGAAGRVGTTHQMPVPTSVGPAVHGAGINGTTMGHMASGSASIGGPAKDRSGINGTLMRPTH